MTGAEHGSVGASGSGDRIPFGSLAGDAVVRVAPRAAVGGTVPSGAALSRVGFVAAVGVGALGIAAFFIGEPRPLHAAWRPAQDLSFRVSATPDTITVGDPIDLELEGSAPTDLPMLWPELADSVGSFAILEITPPVRTEEEGRAKIHQTATLTLYRAGAHELPAIPLLAVQGGDTLVAYGATPTVVVRSLLPADDPNLQNPQTALAQLKDIKGVVPLEPSRWWIWLVGGLVLVGLGYGIYRFLRSRKRAEAVLPAVPRTRTVLSPEAEFEQGLTKLRALLEQGEVKEFYAGLSLLLRTYLERRYQMVALEATRTELLNAVREHPYLEADDERWLHEFLNEADLVKFARLDRLLEDARARADASLDWVRATTKREAERKARIARAQSATGAGGPPPGTPSPGAPSASSTSAPAQDSPTASPIGAGPVRAAGPSHPAPQDGSDSERASTAGTPRGEGRS